MILGSPGKVGRCQIYAPQSESFVGLFFAYFPVELQLDLRASLASPAAANMKPITTERS